MPTAIGRCAEHLNWKDHETLSNSGVSPGLPSITTFACARIQAKAKVSVTNNQRDDYMYQGR